MFTMYCAHTINECIHRYYNCIHYILYTFLVSWIRYLLIYKYLVTICFFKFKPNSVPYKLKTFLIKIFSEIFFQLTIIFFKYLNFFKYTND